MEKIQLDAQNREGTGKGVARALRREKRIPAVIYGGSETPVAISLLGKDILKVINQGGFFTQLCDLNVDGTNHLVLARDVQLDPVLDLPIHADFMRVTERTRIKVNVPIRVTNEEDCLGLSKGGLLNLVHFEVEVYCRAIKIPEALFVDLTGIEMGESVLFESVEMPEGVEASLDGTETIANVTAPAAVRSAGVDDEEGEEGEEGEGETEASEEEQSE